MPQHVDMPTIRGKTRSLGVAAEQIGNQRRGDRLAQSLSAWEEMLRPRTPRLVEILQEETLRARKQRVRVRIASLEPVNLNRVRLQIEVADLEQANLGSTECVVVANMEDQPVATVLFGYHGQEPPNLADAEVLDLAWRALRAFRSAHRARDLHVFLQKRQLPEEIASGRDGGKDVAEASRNLARRIKAARSLE